MRSAVARAVSLMLLGVSSLHAQATPVKRTAADSARATARDTIPKPKTKADSALAKADSVQRAVDDSVRNARAQFRVDSIYQAKLADTIKAPLAHFETPGDVEPFDRLRFSRQQILSTGAVNLADLLDRVPGVTSYRSGWLAGVHSVAFNGGFRRVRVFFDGIERDAVESRNGGMLDLVDIPLITLDEIVIERTATEVRVWLRGWSVRRTTAYTRVDIFTGDLNTNGFRGYFARRFANGLSFQFVGQQAATQTGRVSAFTTSDLATGSGDGTQQLIETRIGWSRGLFTVDAEATGIARDRDPHTAREGFTSLPKYKGGRREGYVRLAYGDSARGLWGQALVGVLRTNLQGIASSTDTATTDSTKKVSLDTIGARTQQLVAVGYRTGLWQLSATDRIRPINGTSYHAPALRFSAGGTRYRISAFAEHRALDSLTQFDVSAIARPFSWLTLVASQGRRDFDTTTQRASASVSRAEALLRVKGLWLGGGVVREGITTVDAPVLFGAPIAMTNATASTGVLGSAHGRLFKAVQLDVQAIHWDAAQFYRPRLDVRSELSVTTNWLSRFPKGEFGFNLRVIHESRDPVPFLWPATSATEQRVAEMSQVVTGLLEIRIQSATLFYQYRNLTGQAYEQIPGLTMPPAVQMYGVRWEFWN